MNREQDIKFWQDASIRHARDGHSTMSITCDNIAWLLQNDRLWTATPIRSASEQAQEYVASLNRPVSGQKVGGQ